MHVWANSIRNTHAYTWTCGCVRMIVAGVKHHTGHTGRSPTNIKLSCICVEPRSGTAWWGTCIGPGLEAPNGPGTANCVLGCAPGSWSSTTWHNILYKQSEICHPGRKCTIHKTAEQIMLWRPCSAGPCSQVAQGGKACKRCSTGTSKAPRTTYGNARTFGNSLQCSGGTGTQMMELLLQLL